MSEKAYPPPASVVARWLLPCLAAVSLIGVALHQPRYASTDNIENVLRQSSFLVVFALAQFLPVLSRGLDLSQGGLVVFCSVVFAILSADLGVTGAAVVTAALGGVVGALSGSLIARMGVSPFVITLGVGSILQGAALLLSGGQPVVDVPDTFSKMSNVSVGRLPVAMIIAIAVASMTWFVLSRVVCGRWVFAVGSNPRASVLAGIPVRGVLTGVYACSGVLTAFGACMLSSRINCGHPTAGADTALQSVAAVVVGGASLFGGSGSVLGVCLGALFFGMLANALNLLNVSPYVQTVIVGCAIIVAVAVDRWRTRLQAGPGSLQ